MLFDKQRGDDMKRILTAGTAVLLTSTMLVGAAVAQPRGFGPSFGYGMGPGYGMGMMGQPGRGRSMMMDANDDGAVSAEEAASAADEVFTAMDADDDGKLDMEEYMAVRMGPQLGYNSDRQAAMQKAKEERFAAMDADADGSVTKEEFLNAAQAHHAAADTDGDGKVTPWEHRRQNWN
jgi:hypothetical protein